LAYGATPVHAAEPVLLHASLVQPGPVVVSERVKITVELLTLTTFASAPVFDLPTIPGALFMKLEDRPVLGTEQIDGESYTVQQHELALFVMRPGAVQVPPFIVRFEFPLHFGEKPVEHRLTTPLLQVEAHMPPGAENLLGLTTTRELHVNQTWQPQPTKADVGDGFTRTVTLTAPDVPGMVFPPLPLTKVDGLAVYPKPPVIQDQVERGDFTGKRIDTVTYICERAGQFTLPALVIPWWDLKNRQLMQVTLPAVTLEVEPGPAPNADVASTTQLTAWQWLWWPISVSLLLAVMVGVIWRKREACLAMWKRWRAQCLGSEAGHFARLLDACGSNDARLTYNALLRWLDSSYHGPDVATIEAFVAKHPDVILRRHVEALQESLLGRTTDWNSAVLAEALRRVRRQQVQRNTTTDEGRLPALNPS
jgi:hypothetical protein